MLAMQPHLNSKALGCLLLIPAPHT